MRSGEGRYDEMDALGWAQEPRAGPAFQPRTGGVHKKLSSDFKFVAGQPVADLGGNGSIALLAQAGQFAVVGTDSTAVGGMANGFNAKPGVVFPTIVVQHSSAQAGGL